MSEHNKILDRSFQEVAELIQSARGNNWYRPEVGPEASMVKKTERNERILFKKITVH